MLVVVTVPHNSRKCCIWLDCCFSGELLNFKDTDLGRHSLGCDRFLIAASRDYEVVYQELDGKHGVLTGALLAGLNPHLVPEFEWITNRTLTVAVEQKLQEYDENTKSPQSPLISNQDFILRIQTIWNETNSTYKFQYQLTSFRFTSVFIGNSIYTSNAFSSSWIEQTRGLLAVTLENISGSLPTEGKSHLIWYKLDLTNKL